MSLEEIMNVEQKEILMRVFQYFCSYGEATNSTCLKSSQFVKLLKDSGLIKGYGSNKRTNPQRKPQNSQHAIQMVDADLIFKKLTSVEKPRSRLFSSQGLPRPKIQDQKKNSNPPKQLQFPQFLKALVMVGAKLNGLVSEKDQEAQLLNQVFSDYIC